ncbi:alpha/beta fold hydrolase [Pseudonocardia sp. TRM90224]|uniref:alpha/beta fold hydrolase n=1 Tax=Pseudonocardia sp. TRM90224 TaxID=2812678 RepID=UPI001E4D2DEB|nr:alpha/beta fold hydrolase [Pseudonocardia sp. TRM90224]
MRTVLSQDGTTIAFDQIGAGPPLVLVAGASCDRGVDAPIAQGLAEHFTVLNYDRRGRGDSGNTLPFAVEREIEDIAALLDAAGGSAVVLGLSSGAALAAHAATAGLPISALVLWEPPFVLDPDSARETKEYTQQLHTLLAQGRYGDAVEHFMRRVGLPDEMIEGMRHSPYWALGERLAPTLAYDAAVMGDATVPTDLFATISAPTLLLAGSSSPAWMREAAQAVAGVIPGAQFDVLEGQDHNVAGDVLAPAVRDFLTG